MFLHKSEAPLSVYLKVKTTLKKFCIEEVSTNICLYLVYVNIEKYDPKKKIVTSSEKNNMSFWIINKCYHFELNEILQLI